ncbi:glycosyltransferase family 2 protein [Hymenobacter arizonensis]|uniref:Glycosyltransferase, catalytic subunit of cellulose synthase and poly-beta-1,6-N-acetylglucosamine synthase n=1 Tax=Hymenobacter arizonensis TaxID=1227077 RepID=A0A1I5Z699_HYMAR|nr:glycosyltransferase family 2 protein [Hymenobacter arizonensis]SFQ51971.1 Glycosyltransferase, catalytic subunit of cellulose synthase and poly-beta-1,6-N-acetylglucosamine synthase [Hymenobacter arizonensis]
MLVFLFWLSLTVVLFTYVGYALVVWVWAKLARGTKKAVAAGGFEPEVTLVVPAYNEADILDEKVRNCLALDYPAEKLHLMFITDGSNDHSGAVLAKYPEVQHLHSPERAGKSMAENRAIRYVKTPYVIFTDCNTLLNPEAARQLVRHYADPRVGAVSGEKRVLRDGSTSGAGEGLYWKYESFLKQCDSDIYSLMGAAGELVSFRTDLFKPLEADTILDDFVQSMRIVDDGYRVIYEPQAYAMEPPSFSLKEEMKRKVRICAGGWQSMARLLPLLNPLRQPVVAFLYFSHRVLRWSITPALLLLLLPLNAALAVSHGGIYTVLLVLQGLFYGAAALGWYQASRGKAAGPLLVPLYFTMMNVAVFQGAARFFRNSQPAAWDKAQRAPVA